MKNQTEKIRERHIDAQELFTSRKDRSPQLSSVHINVRKISELPRSLILSANPSAAAQLLLSNQFCEIKVICVSCAYKFIPLLDC